MSEDHLHERLRHDLTGTHLAPGTAAALVGRRRRSTRTMRVVAGVVAVAVVGSGLAAATSSRAGEQDSLSPAGPSASGNRALLVQDGDRVTGSSRIVQLPGRAPQFCGSETRAAIGYLPGQEPAPGPCLYGIDLAGVDMATLSERREKDGAVEGWASITGVLDDGTITVQAQGAPTTGPDSDQPDLSTPPCAEPADGWAPGEPDLAALSPYLDDDGSGELNGLVQTSPRPGTIVMVASARDEIARDRIMAALRPRLPNLCLLVGGFSGAQVRQAQDELQPQWPTLRSTSSGIGAGRDFREHLELSVLIVDEQVLDVVRAYPDGLVRLEPALRPVRD